MRKVLAVLLFFALVLSSLPAPTHASSAPVMAKENHFHPGITHFKGKKPPKKKEQNKLNEDKKKQEELKKKQENYDYAKRDGNKASEHEDVKGRALPTKGSAFGSKDLYQDNQLTIRRYYDANGKADEDIHFTDHKQPKWHKVPHRHKWTWNGETPKMGDGY